MALADLSVLAKHKRMHVAPDQPPDRWSFFAPVDDVHSALLDVVTSATQSLVLCMFGFDDDELADIIKAKLEHPEIVVQLTLDSSQAGGVHERTILARENYPRSIVAVGRSEHGAIMHEKVLIVDGLDVVTGSTNWSTSAETKQDNELVVTRSRAVAADYRARADAIHAHMLQAATGRSA